MKREIYTFLVLVIPLIFLIAACKPTEIKDGNVAYNLKKYTLAVELLTKEYQAENDPSLKADLAYKLGRSYEAINKTAKAETWYFQAANDGYGLEARVRYTKMLQANEKYEQAIAEYQEMIKEEPFRRAEFASAISAIKRAQEWMSETSNITIENLGINTSWAEFSPVYYEERDLVFASSRPQATGEEGDQWTGNQFYDIFMAERDENGLYGNVEIFSAAVNSKFNDGPATFNSDFTIMYFTQCGTEESDRNDFCNIFMSERLPDGGWGQPEPVFLFQDSINVGHPSLSEDGKTLFYSAVDPQGMGGADIYFSVETFDGWSEPINLGSRVNTSGDEVFPYIHTDGVLYFSSSGHPGMGGLDIFSAEKEGNQWGSVTQLKYPINSPADDFGLLLDPLTKQQKEFVEMRGFFTSTREGGKGMDDIYSFEWVKPEPKYELIVDVKYKELVDPEDPNSAVNAIKPLPGSTVTLIATPGAGESLVDSLVVNEEGTVRFEIESNTDYKLLASNQPEYFTGSEEATTKGIRAKRGETVTIEREIILDRIFEDVEISIPNIYYDLDSAVIRPDAAAVLDTTILPLLKENPDVIVEIGSHTDSRGSDKYNLDLSQRRAEAVVNYLTRHGIDAERMVARGYGETVLLNECDDGVECTEEEHQRNRRTTFRVLGKDVDVQSEEPGQFDSGQGEERD